MPTVPSNVVKHNLGDTYAFTADFALGVYATNGVTITPDQIGLPASGAIENIDVPGVQGSRFFEAAPATTGVPWKIKAYTALGTEVTNGTDLSAVVLRLDIRGK